MLRRDAEVFLRIFTRQIDPMLEVDATPHTKEIVDVSVIGYAAKFGADLSAYVPSDEAENATPMRNPDGLAVRRDMDNVHGCDPYDKAFNDSVLLVHRGHCTFLEKLIRARDASAAGIIIVSDEEMGINPTANADELLAAGDLSRAGVVLLTKTIGQALEEMVAVSEKFQSAQIMVSLLHTQNPGSQDESERIPVEQEEEQFKDPNRILYINGHALINTRLLV